MNSIMYIALLSQAGACSAPYTPVMNHRPEMTGSRSFRICLILYRFAIKKISIGF